LCVSQNNGATKLYINQRAKRGVRVTLRGSAGNPEAVGAQMRIDYGRRPSGVPAMGPMRTIQAGSGYRSQDAAPQVLGLKDGARPEGLWIRWPNGKEETVALEKDVWEITRAEQ